MDQQTFDKHPVWESVSTLESTISQAVEVAQDHPGSQLERLRYVAAQLRGRATDNAMPYAATPLQKLKDQLDQINNHINGFVSTSGADAGHLDNAMGPLDQAQHSIGLLPCIAEGEHASAQRQYEAYRQMAEGALSTLEGRVAQLTDELESRDAAAKERETQAKQTVDELSGRVDGIREQLSADEGRLAEALTAHSETFTKAQEERAEKFGEWLLEQGNELKGLARTNLEEIQALQVKATIEAKEATEAINKHRSDVEAVASLAAGDVLAGHFKEYATAERKRGLWWSGVGVALVVIAATTLFFTVADVGPSEDVSWQFTALKLGLSAAVGGAAAVAVRIGTTATQRAHEASSVELELRSIGPFLAEADTGERVGAKIGFVRRRFGQNGTPPSTSGSEAESSRPALGGSGLPEE